MLKRLYKCAFLAVATCLVGTAFVGTANAQSTVSYNFTSITNQQTPFSLDSNVEQFDPDLGNLISVQISFTDSITTQLTVTNNAASASSGYATTKVTMGITDPDGNLPNPAFNGSGVVNSGGFAVIATSAHDNYTLAAGASVGPTTKTGSASDSMTFSSTNNSNMLTEMTGTGDVDFNVSTYATTSVTNTGGNTSAVQTTDASFVGTVIYTYQPTPATPGELSLLAGVLVGAVQFGGARLRRNRKSNITAA